MTVRVLFADACHRSAVAKLRARGFECVEKPQADADGLGVLLDGVDVLVVRSTEVTAAAMAASRSLSLIVRAGAGVNNIDVAAASARGVYVCNTPGRNAVAVAELTMGLMIAADRHIAAASADLHGGTWDKRGYSAARGLKRRSLGIVGLGRIGMAVASRAGGFGMRLHALRRPGRDSLTRSRIEELDITLHDELVDMAAVSDVLTLHLAGAEQVVNAAVLEAMPPGAILLNTARAGLVDTEALIAAMDAKGLRVGLDVFDDEPGEGTGPFNSRLAQHPNVVATPHIGASTEQAQEAVASAIVKVIRAYAAGRIVNCVNLETGRVGNHVVVVRHQDRVGVLASVLQVLRRHDLNVARMDNRIFRDSTSAVASMDVSGPMTSQVRTDIVNLPHVYQVEIRPVTADEGDNTGGAALAAAADTEEVRGRVPSGGLGVGPMTTGVAAPDAPRQGLPVLLPFAATVVRQEWAARVASPAYDGLGVEQRRELLLAQPDSYMHATRSPEDVGYSLSPAELAVLNQMALIRLLRLNAFEPRPGAAVYVYTLDGYGWRQRGIVGAVPLDAYRRGQIRPHEQTHAAREEMLSEFLALTSAQSSPVALTFRSTSRIGALLEGVEAVQEPLLDFTDVNGVEQRIWEVTDPSFAAAVNEDLAGRNLYVTDGHHRLGAGLVVSERARRQRQESAAAGGFLASDVVLATLGHSPSGIREAGLPEEPLDAGEADVDGDAYEDGALDAPEEVFASDAILAALFPHDELRILVFHRRVTPVGDVDGETIGAALRQLGTLLPVTLADAEPRCSGQFGVYLDGRWFRFTPAGGVEGIDAAWLQSRVIGPIFGVADPEHTRHIEYVSGVLGLNQLAGRCDAAGGVGFALHPVAVETMMAVADARQVMPPKSTFFHPKPRSGVFLRFQ